MSDNEFDDILRASRALQDAKVPMSDRYMYYHVICWWRHPIKRWKQKRAIKSILETSN